MESIEKVTKKRPKNKALALYFSKEELKQIDEYCEKYLSSPVVFIKILMERFIKAQREKIENKI